MARQDVTKNRRPFRSGPALMMGGGVAVMLTAIAFALPVWIVPLGYLVALSGLGALAIRLVERKRSVAVAEEAREGLGVPFRRRPV